MRAAAMSSALSIAILAVSAAASAQQIEGPSGEIVIETPLEGRKTILPNWRYINPAPLGERENPVRVYMPPGQRAYLSRLICPEGGAPAFSRAGSAGKGPFGTVLDMYTVTCASMARRVFLDMYHPDYVERRPVPGFRIRDP
ncbi:MAG: hypothetical protein JNL07_02110 [Rhodospirillales bacterium]|nr:hypothetical protein [Rhodospirillales bacterium]